MNANAQPGESQPSPDEPARQVAGGGGPPYDRDMDRRVIILKTRLDTIFPTLATKAGLAELRTEVQVGFETLRAETQVGFETLRHEMHALQANTMKWMIATLIAMFVGFGGMFFTFHQILTEAMAARAQPAPAVPTISPDKVR